MFSKFTINVSWSAILDHVTCKIRLLLNFFIAYIIILILHKNHISMFKNKKDRFGVIPDLKATHARHFVVVAFF